MPSECQTYPLCTSTYLCTAYGTAAKKSQKFYDRLSIAIEIEMIIVLNYFDELLCRIILLHAIVKPWNQSLTTIFGTNK